MSRVKERENVLCAGGVGSETSQERATTARLWIQFHFPAAINQRKSQRKDRSSIRDAGWKILPRAVFETADIQQAPLNRKGALAKDGPTGIAMIPVIMTTEEFEIWR